MVDVGIIIFLKDPKDEKAIKVEITHSVWNQALDFPDTWTTTEAHDRFYGLVGFPKSREACPIVKIPLSLFEKIEPDDDALLSMPSLSIFPQQSRRLQVHVQMTPSGT